MSSNLSVFDGSFLKHLAFGMFSSDGGTDPLCFSDPFTLLSDAPAEVFHENSDTLNQKYTLDESSNSFLSSSPLSNQMEDMSLCQVQPLSTGLILDNEFDKFSILEGLEVKNGECKMGFDSSCNQPFFPHSYVGFENVAKYMGRSFSCNDSLDHDKPRFLFQPSFTSAIMDSCGSNNQSLTSPDQSFRAGEMRRVCSTGDLQNAKVFRVNQMSPTNSMATEGSLREDSNLKVGRYTAEERKERISKYRAKRTQRNFNKTIKYACRKTLADTRPRIRGRFARNDVETRKVSYVTGENEEELWLDGLHEEQDDQRVGQQSANHFGMTQFHYYGYR